MFVDPQVQLSNRTGKTMNLAFVIALLSFDAAIFVGMPFFFDSARHEKRALFPSLLFFFSGMPAMVYQIVWQRALFAIYGVNAESVAVVVTAFMIGLGIGSLVGGRLSTQFPAHAIVMFGIAELGVALFGLGSLHVFHWAAGTAGANLVLTVVFSLLLLLIPTVLMGATLPLLVEHLVLRTSDVGTSVATLYFANTFGSAVACYLCATLLLRNFGQSGSVTIAACMNTGVGATAYLYARSKNRNSERQASAKPAVPFGRAAMPLYHAMVLAGLSGFIALGFEILWFHVFSVASSDRAPAFALLLCTYLAGIAAGSLLSEKVTAGWRPKSLVHFVGGLLVLSGALSAYLPPVVASLMARKIPFLVSAPVFFVTAALIGSVLPLLCQLAVPPERQAGQGVSLIYVSNIAGSALGSLLVGFVFLQYFGLKQMSVTMGLAAVIAGSILLIFYCRRGGMAPAWAIALTLAGLVAVPVSLPLYRLLYERLVFGARAEASVPFVHIVENRNGVIGVTRDGAVFGGGVYDGYFNVDPTNDVNLVARVYLLSAFCPSPKRVLVIGLASGSWAQILANHPQVETLDAVEINPGYVQLIPQYAIVQSFLHNPRVRIYIDDARRWLYAHPEARYDAIVANTTFNWRDHSSGLLSVEFLNLIRSHLNRGGIYYFNSTESDETIATALRVFPYGLRVINFVAASDSPIAVDKERLIENLHGYKIDGKLLFDSQSNPAAQKALAAYAGLVDTLKAPPRFLGLEYSDSLRARLGRRLIITDDNMGLEWRSEPLIPWH